MTRGKDPRQTRRRDGRGVIMFINFNLRKFDEFEGVDFSGLDLDGTSETTEESEEENTEETTEDTGEESEKETKDEGAEDKEDLSDEEYTSFKAKYKDKFQQEIESILARRLKKANATEKELQDKDNTLNELFEITGAKDTKELSELIRAQTEKSIEQEAFEKGIEAETYKKMKEADRITAQYEAEKQARKKAAETAQQWRSAEADIKKDYKDFDLNTLIANTEFRDLLQETQNPKAAYEIMNAQEILEAEYSDFDFESWDNTQFNDLLKYGVDIGTAFKVSNEDYITARIAKSEEKKVVETIKAGKRPKENAKTGGKAVKTKPYAEMSDEEILKDVNDLLGY